VQAGGQSGTVREIGLFTTLLTTRDLVYVSVPNAAVFGGTIANYTREPLRRVSFSVPIDYVNDIARAQEVLLAALKKNEHVLPAPEPSVGVQELQEYAVVLFVRAYIKSVDYWTAMPAIQKSVKESLDAAQILIAVTRQAAAVRAEPAQTGNASPPDPSA
jgi:small conductance mechanosensitive channel